MRGWIKGKKRGKKDLSFFIKHFGPEEATELYKLHKLACRENSSWCIEYYLKRGYSEVEGRAIIFKLQSRSKKRFIEKYGNEEGEKKYNLFIEHNRTNLESFIRKHGKEKGELKYKEWTKKAAQAIRLSDLVEKYGIEEGKRRHQQHIDSAKKTWNAKPENEKKEINKKKAITLENLINKYGVEKGKMKYEEYMGNYKHGTSKESQKLFWKLYEIIKAKINIKANTIYFSELNKEYFIYEKRIYFLDFVYNKKCVEYNGDKWHGNPEIYKENDCPTPFGNKKTCKQLWEYDKQKKELIEKRGFKLLIVWESDVKKNEVEVIQKCIKFLLNDNIIQNSIV
jgi:hypothetical protein